MGPRTIDTGPHCDGILLLEVVLERPLMHIELVGNRPPSLQCSCFPALALSNEILRDVLHSVDDAFPLLKR